MKKSLSFLKILALVLSLAAGSALASEAEDPAAVVGVKDGHSYANEFLGIMASFEDDWYVMNDEETIEAMGDVADSLENQELADRLRNSGVVCDLYAETQDNSGDNINIQIENLGFLYGTILNEEDYYKAAAPQLETALAQMGVEKLRVEKETLEFAGTEHVGIRVSGTYQGTPVYERMALVKAGSYMATVTAGSFDAGRAENMLKVFEAYDAEKLAA